MIKFADSQGAVVVERSRASTTAWEVRGSNPALGNHLFSINDFNLATTFTPRTEMDRSRLVRNGWMAVGAR